MQYAHQKEPLPWSASTPARVFTLRALLCWNIITCAVPWGVPTWGVPNRLPQMAICFLTIAHHVYVPFARHKKFFMVDLSLLTLEIILMLHLFPLFPAVNWVLLGTFLYCRFAGKGGTTFDFFAGCEAGQQTYTPFETLFGRRLSRPLIRGESQAIVSIRAIILFSLCLAIPAFGIYVAMVMPIRGQAFTRSPSISNSWYLSLFPGYDPTNANSFYWSPSGYHFTSSAIAIAFFFDYFGGPINITISMTVENATRECPMVSTNNSLSLAICDWRWDQVPQDGLLVSANFSDPWGVLYVNPGEGKASDVDGYTAPMALTAGSHLAAILDMTERDVFSNTALDYFGITTPLRKIVLRPVLLLQEDRMPPNSGLDTVSLRLRPRADISVAAKVVQDYTDVSVLNGLATFGGFWTFMNGGFALFFGANILYFLYNTRPLSALGLVHWFQRRALLRQWHEDFPALQTEGGQSGSETAGIVAFIRERLVDVEDVKPKQEPQNTPSGKQYRWISPTQLALVEIHPKIVEKRRRTSKETSGLLDEEDRHLDATFGFEYLAGIS
ncbi:hypothetical protein GGX14DRAFT_582415 [Mycena pura]|uniref:Transmembrane protein n=1 Tax=Mycena pura TaxID=153505 RepID=A0AAD6YV58_9AGAR|nr:hypothetical protein GGX14DRAFT_582415 [Mycena pura]